MDSNPFLYSPQHSHPSSQSAPFVLPSAYHPHPAVYPGHPGIAPNYGGYNVVWGPEQEHLFFSHLANQMATGQPAATGVATTANNNGLRCIWDSGGIPCNQDCVDFNDLILHLGSVHDMQGPADKMLVCLWLTERGVCGGEYRRHAFRRHIGTHLGHSVRCPDCGKSYSRGDSMRAHARKKHGMQ